MNRTEPEVGPLDDWEDPETLPVEQVQDLFLTLSKALQAFQLYDAGNPVYQRFMAGLREAFREVWHEVERLEILVQEDRLLWMGEEIYRNDNRNQSLAFLLYRDGIREFTLRPGIEGSGLEPLLQALHKGRSARRDGDDLVTVLWELDLEHFEYSHVDYLAESVELPTAEGEELDLLPIFREELGTDGDLDEPADEEAPGTGEPIPGTVRQEDFNPTLYALDPSEMETVRSEVRAEMERDLRDDVLSALFDRLEEPRRSRQLEILDILDTLLPGFLATGEVTAAGRVLAELKTIAQRDGALDEEGLARVERIFEEISSPESVGELVKVLEDGSAAAGPDELAALLRHFRAGALEPLLRAAGQVADPGRKRVLQRAVWGIAEAHPRTLGRLLDADDPAVVAGAARLAGRMGLPGVEERLEEMLEHPEPTVRVAVVEAVATFPHGDLHEALMDALDDVERDVRIAAARALVEVGLAPAADRLREHLQSRELREADLGEQRAFFDSYARLAGAEAVDVLDRLLNGGVLGFGRGSSEIRGCAALALGIVGTPQAEKTLRKAEEDGDPVVRNAVGRALRGEVGDDG